MDDIRQSTVNSLNYFLTEKQFITNDGNSIKFSLTDNSFETPKGTFVIDGSKNGTYTIFFSDKLTLALTATDDFKFVNFMPTQLGTISLESATNRVDSILLLLEGLKII